MSGGQLRSSIKQLGLTHEQAANLLGISRRTLNNWFALDKLDANTVEIVHKTLQITSEGQSEARFVKADIDRLLGIIESQQRTIENLSNKV